MSILSSTRLLNRLLLALAVVICGSTSSAKVLRVPEPALEKAVADTLRVNREALTKELVAEKLLFLEASGLQLRDLTGLEAAKNLEVLILRDNFIEDLSPLSNLSKLRKLDLSGNRIRSLAPLEGLSLAKMKQEFYGLSTSLESRTLTKDAKARLVTDLEKVVARINEGPWALRDLSLANNRLLGLTGVGSLTSLRYLDVSSNSLIDLEGVGNLKSLITLYAQRNQLGRVEGYLDVDKDKKYTEGVDEVKDESGNGKWDSDPLFEIQSMPSLVNLYLYDNLLTTTSLLKDLPNLKILLLSGNKLEDVSNMRQFNGLLRLALSSNRITDLAGLEGLDKLEHLYLEENQVCDLRSLSALPAIRELRLQSNQIMSVKILEQLKKLRVVSLSNNFIHDPFPVFDLPELKRLSLSSNRISPDERALEEKLERMRIGGKFVTLGSQKKRIPELERLLYSLMGHPSSNKILGDYLLENDYERLIDFADDQTVSQEVRNKAYKQWEVALRLGKLNEETPFPGK